MMDKAYSAKRISRSEYRPPSRIDSRRKSLQDEFLSQCIVQEINVDIFLRNESIRTGRVIDYDNWSVLIETEEKQYLLFKSAIMGIIPQHYLLIENAKDPSYQRVAEEHSAYNFYH